MGGPLLPAYAWAVACNTIFSNGIQATAANGNISLNYHSIITGGSGTLQTKTLTDNTSWVACSGSSCAASGVPATTSTPTFLTGSQTNGAINLAANSTASYAAGDYGTVSVGQQSILTFSTSSGVYKTRAFTTAYQSEVRLPPGDYWINGNLTLAQETILRRVGATTGATRIFVNGNVTMGFKMNTQNFTSGQLLIYATGTITGDNQVVLNAFVYGGGAVSFNFQSIINGAVSGASFMTSGNEVTVNYQPSNLTSADFSPFCSGTTVTPVLLGSWNMDEGSWSGAAGEVIDSSGNNNHGRARIAAGSTPLPSTTSGSAAYTAGAQSTCRYGAFDGTGSPTRTYSYVELSGFPSLPNGFTFAAWIRSSNASAQHQRILVRDDAQNGWGFSLADGTGAPALRFFNRNVTNNGAVTGQGTNPNCGVFCVDTNPVITSNTWYYVAASVDTTAKTVTLYVYTQAGTLLAKATGAYSGNWVDGTGTVAIGGETSASSEGQQTSWHFLGNIDEVNIYSGALSQTSIEALLPTVRTCPAPDHYELQVASQGVACMGTDVTVRACADSAVPCNQDNSVNSNVTLSTDAGALNATTFALSAGSATTKIKYPAAADGAQATVTLQSVATAATNSTKCCTGTSSCSVANSCKTSFNTAGFIFSNNAISSGDIATGTAATTNSNAYLRAVKTNSTTGACMARFTSSQPVKMAYQCINPSTCTTSGQTLTLNGTAVQKNDASVLSNVVYGATDVSLNFDSNGSAPIPINYTDVGQIKLWASLPLAATTTEPAYTLTGFSNDFVVKPASVRVTAVQTTTGGNNPGNTNQSGEDKVFVTAGTPFAVTVQAYNSAGNLTPNFGKEISTQLTNITLTAAALVYPDPAKSYAYLSPISYTTGAWSPVTGGGGKNSTVYWSQVGSLTIAPGLTAYLGVGSVPGVTSGTIGRFTPDHYRLVTANTAVTNGCGSFSYMGQPNLTIKPYIQAESLDNQVVTNYHNADQTSVAAPLYGSLTNTLAEPLYAAENNGNGFSLNDRISVATGSWRNGIYADSLIGTFARGSGPEAPMTSVRVGLWKMKDNTPYNFDAIKSIAGTKDMLVSSSANAAFAFKDPSSAGNKLLNMVFGRLRLDSAFGPETADMPVGFATEFWTGSYFAPNTADSCTLIPRSAVTYPAGSLAADINRTVALTSGSTQGMYSGITAAGIPFAGGKVTHYFTAPGSGNRGTFNVTLNMAGLAWLTDDWNKDLSYTDTSYTATYTFESYRGNDRIIYWREILQ
jgi:MSHA biogenesis protein MshQ